MRIGRVDREKAIGLRSYAKVVEISGKRKLKRRKKIRKMMREKERGRSGRVALAREKKESGEGYSLPPSQAAMVRRALVSLRT